MAELRAEAGRPTVARIDLGAIRANFARAQELARGREVIAVVKADAYGHGVVRVTQTLVASGAQRVAVANVDEGVDLRAAFPDLEILVLGGVFSAAEADAAAGLGLTPVLHQESQRALVVEGARRRGRRIEVHVEVDTGMRRLGVPESEALDLLTSVAAEPELRLAGVLTHFARADEPDPVHLLEPLARFRELLAQARARGVAPGLVHVANSAALLALHKTLEILPEQAAVRPGLMLYGVSPAAHLGADLTPAMTLATAVVALRGASAGDTVGYSGTHHVASPTRIATLPLGYADGVPWSLGNQGCVLIRGRRAPIVGRVSMDLITVDVGEGAAEIGDEVILFGVGQGTALPVEEVARAAGTLSYELLVRVGRRVPRIFSGD